MGRRALLLLAAAALGLATASAGLLTYLHHAARRSVDELLARRLEAVGTATARLIASAPDRNRALLDIAQVASLDGAYLVDRQLSVTADAHGHAGTRANLLRLDPDRAQAALDGKASVGWAFDVDGVRFLGGYFPLARDDKL